MADSPINERIERMGIGTGQDSTLLLTLLPLVHVAWADDEIHSAEADYIRKVAEESGISAEGMKVLEKWLHDTPTSAYVLTGMDLVRELAQRGDIRADKLREIIVDSRRVAQAAGGLFNTLYTVNPAEKSLIAEIAVLFCAQSIDWDKAGLSWQEIEDSLH